MFSGVLRNENDIDHDTTEAFVDQVRAPVLEHGAALLLYSASCARSCLSHASLLKHSASLQARIGYSAGARHDLQGSMLEHMRQMQCSSCMLLLMTDFARLWTCLSRHFWQKVVTSTADIMSLFFNICLLCIFNTSCLSKSKEKPSNICLLCRFNT